WSRGNGQPPARQGGSRRGRREQGQPPRGRKKQIPPKSEDQDEGTARHHADGAPNKAESATPKPRDREHRKIGARCASGPRHAGCGSRQATVSISEATSWWTSSEPPT